MDYVELKISCNEEYRDILIAELGEAGFDTFQEHEVGFSAFVLKKDYNIHASQEILDRYRAAAGVVWELCDVERKNWNEEWEKNYDPITVEDKVLVRASFHKIDRRFPYEIIINPKMSFGTGHHSTTYLMMAWQTETDHVNKSVIDIGCGTGILAALAAKLGATKVYAIDNYDWAIENSKENFQLNNVDIKTFEGSIEYMPWKNKFDIILANITKNVLLEEIKNYVAQLEDSGTLLVSGFYEKDLEEIRAAFIHEGLVYQGFKKRLDWVSAKFLKA